MIYKKCATCKEDKLLDEYIWKSKVKDLRESNCNVCRKSKAKQWYDLNKKSVIDSVQRRKETNRANYAELKGNLGCKFCDEKEPCCLDFHHLDPSKKDIEVSALIVRGSKARLIAEIAKCICVCSNCHRKIHSGLIVA